MELDRLTESSPSRLNESDGYSPLRRNTTGRRGLHKKTFKSRPYSVLENPDGSQMTIPDFLDMAKELRSQKEQGVLRPIPKIKGFGLAHSSITNLKKLESEHSTIKKKNFWDEINKHKLLLPVFNENLKDKKNEYYHMLEGNIREYEEKRLAIQRSAAEEEEANE